MPACLKKPDTLQHRIHGFKASVPGQPSQYRFRGPAHLPGLRPREGSSRQPVATETVKLSALGKNRSKRSSGMESGFAALAEFRNAWRNFSLSGSDPRPSSQSNLRRGSFHWGTPFSEAGVAESDIVSICLNFSSAESARIGKAVRFSIQKHRALNRVEQAHAAILPATNRANRQEHVLSCARQWILSNSDLLSTGLGHFHRHGAHFNLLNLISPSVSIENEN